MPYALLQKELSELPVERLKEAFRLLPDLVDADARLHPVGAFRCTWRVRGSQGVAIH